MPKDETPQQRFEKELKSRVLLKTSPSMLPEKVLVEAFKYLDLPRSGKCNAATFLKVMRVRLGLTATSDEELEAMFARYAQGMPELNYKEFVGGIFQSQVGYTITDRMSKRDGVEMPQNRFDLAKHEDSIRKNIDFIVYKLRGGHIGAFFGLYAELAANKSSQGEVTSGHFHQALKKSGIELSADDTQKIFYYVSQEKPLMALEQLFDYLLANYTEERQAQVIQAFSRFDYTVSQKVSLQLVKELFFSRNFPGVREGRFTWEELLVQFDRLTNAYSKFNKDTFVVSQSQFLHFFGFLSGFISQDSDFSQFIDTCFRFSELPRSNMAKDGSTRFTPQSRVIEELSVRNTPVEDLLDALAQQLSAKGERGFIFFFKVLKCNDFDSDGRVFEREFEKTLNESRLNFSKPQTQRLFEQFSGDKKGLRVLDLINQLVPRFEPDRVKLIADLYSRLLFVQSGSASVSFDQVVSVFSAKQHPDFKKGLRADYEIKAEFEDCLKTFLTLFAGSHQTISQEAFLRFFEFYGRNWDLPYMESVLQMAFKVRMPATRSEFSRPYGTHLDPERPVSTVSGRSGANQSAMTSSSLLDEYRKNETRKPYTPSNILAHEENPKKAETPYQPDPKNNILAHDGIFQKKPVDHRVAYPYYTAEGRSIRAGFEGRSQAQFSRYPHHDARIDEPPGPVQRFETNSQESKKPKSPQSEFNPNKQEDLEHTQKNIVNSPEDGSVIPPDEHFRYSSDLNEKLEVTSVRTQPKVDNEVLLRRKLIDLVRAKGKWDLFLDMELQMTEQADPKGFIDFEVFSSTLERFGLTRGMKQSETSAIYIAFLLNAEKLHVQKFVNSIRGQMTKQQEEAAIALFDSLTPPDYADLSLTELKNAFLPHKFRFGVYKTSPEAKEVFGRMVDFFAALNLEMHGRAAFELDEFLYFMDNFAFFLSSNDEFVRMTESVFKPLSAP